MKNDLIKVITAGQARKLSSNILVALETYMSVHSNYGAMSLDRHRELIQKTFSALEEAAKKGKWNFVIQLDDADTEMVFTNLFSELGYKSFVPQGNDMWNIMWN